MLYACELYNCVFTLRIGHYSLDQLSELLYIRNSVK